jgi:hypothetical protein
MKIISLGPSPAVNVGGFPSHPIDKTRDYPDAIGKELLGSKKQRFELAVDPDEKPKKGK